GIVDTALRDRRWAHPRAVGERDDHSDKRKVGEGGAAAGRHPYEMNAAAGRFLRPSGLALDEPADLGALVVAHVDVGEPVPGGGPERAHHLVLVEVSEESADEEPRQHAPAARRQ